MTEPESKTLMEHHGITTTLQTSYHYKGFRYGNLMDALNYAELVTSREFASREQSSKRTNR